MGKVFTYSWTWLAFSACFYVSSSYFRNRVPLCSQSGLCSAGSTGEHRGAPAGLAVTAYDLRTMYPFLFFPLCVMTLSVILGASAVNTLGRGLLERRKQALTSRRLWLAEKVIHTARRCSRQTVESKPVQML